MGGGKTYFIDIDGTIVSYLTNEQLDAMITTTNPYSTTYSSSSTCVEQLLPGVKELWESFSKDDVIVITTARFERHRQFTEKIFSDNNLVYSHLIMELTNGPRILINDTPDIFYKKAIAINVRRNDGFYFKSKK
jgi:hypothetical protein